MKKRGLLSVMQRQKTDMALAWNLLPFLVKANKQGECMEMVPLTAIDKADTGWVMVASALVLLMTLPGIALFYAGWCVARMWSTPWWPCSRWPVW